MRRLFFLVLLVPLLPIVDWTLLFRLGAARGGAAVLGLVLIGLVAGAWLCRRGPPLSPSWIAGALLAFPGPCSDLLGLLFLVPAVRRALFVWILRGAGIRGTAPNSPGSVAPERDIFGPPGERRTGRRGAATPAAGSGRVRDVDYRMVVEEPAPDGRRE